MAETLVRAATSMRALAALATFLVFCAAFVLWLTLDALLSPNLAGLGSASAIAARAGELLERGGRTRMRAIAEFARESELAAFDELHRVLVVADATTGQVHVAGPLGTAQSLACRSMRATGGAPVQIAGVHRVESTDEYAVFLLRAASPPLYELMLQLDIAGGQPPRTMSAVPTPAQLAAWQSAPDWPESWPREPPPPAASPGSP